MCSSADVAEPRLSPTGSRAAPAQEVTPTSIHLLNPASAAAAAAAASPHKAQRLHSPSPAILNFTLQNLGLISGSAPGSGCAASPTPERLNALALQQRGMVFVKPGSPLPLQQSVSGQQVALISVQQVKTGSSVQSVRTVSDGSIPSQKLQLDVSLSATRGRLSFSVQLFSIFQYRRVYSTPFYLKDHLMAWLHFTIKVP